MRSDRPRVLLGLLVALVGGFAVGTVGTFQYRFGLPGPGGSVVVGEDVYGLAGLIGAVVVVAVVLGTPRIRRRRSPGARGDDGILVAPLPAGGEKERGPQ